MATPREAPQHLVARGYDAVAERYAALEGAREVPYLWIVARSGTAREGST